MRVKFKSFKQPDKYGYSYDTDAWTSRAEVSSAFRIFETYGDGLTQHSGDWPITKDFLPDYLASLAVAMSEPDPDELIQSVGYTLSRGPSDEEIAFAAGVIWKESDQDWNKRRWFSLELKKITSSAAKEHDKRFSRIEKHHDGTPGAVYTILKPEYSGDLERYLYAEGVRTWFNHLPNGQHMDMAPLFLGWWKEEWRDNGSQRVREECRFLANALEACKFLIEAHRLRDNAVSRLSSLRYNWDATERARKAEAETKAALAAVVVAEPLQITDGAESVN